jgi:hypothetical protein
VAKKTDVDLRQPGEVREYTDLFTPEDAGGTTKIGLPLPELPDDGGPRAQMERALQAQAARVKERGMLPTVVPDGLDYAKRQQAQHRAQVDPKTGLLEGNRPVLPAGSDRPRPKNPRLGRRIVKKMLGPDREIHETSVTITDQSSYTTLRYDPVAECPGARGGPCAARWHQHGASHAAALVGFE